MPDQWQAKWPLLAWLVIALASSNTSAAQQPSGLPEHLMRNGAISIQEACDRVADLTTQSSPANIYPSASKCIELGNYSNAAKLPVLAAAFGRFDMLRVPDSTSHQVVQILQLHYMQNLSNDQRARVNFEIEKLTRKNSVELDDFCDYMRRLGPPKYDPSYMEDHGMNAFVEERKISSPSNFEGEKAWNALLVNELFCKPKNMSTHGSERMKPT